MANTLSVMTNVLRNVVSKQRIRYKEKGFNLDLAYISDSIIAMGYPADNIESIYRNRLEDVYKFLEENHHEHYKIYNLCLERSYDINKFHGRVAVYPFEDHNPPTIELILKFCHDVDSWLKLDSSNVAAIHCKAGKGRTGTMICCYLLYSGLQMSAEDALACYDEKRTKDRKGVTIPSQRRYVQYFAKLIQSGQQYKKKTLQFCEIRFPDVNSLQSHGPMYCSISVLEDSFSGRLETLQTFNIDFRKKVIVEINNPCLPVAGDIKVELSHKSSRKRIFHFWFNTYFVCDTADIEDEGNYRKFIYTLYKSEIDEVHKDKEHKCFSENFKVQMVFQLSHASDTNSTANALKSRVEDVKCNSSMDSATSRAQSSAMNTGNSCDLNNICDQTYSTSASVCSLNNNAAIMECENLEVSYILECNFMHNRYPLERHQTSFRKVHSLSSRKTDPHSSSILKSFLNVNNHSFLKLNQLNSVQDCLKSVQDQDLEQYQRIFFFQSRLSCRIEVLAGNNTRLPIKDFKKPSRDWKDLLLVPFRHKTHLFTNTSTHFILKISNASAFAFDINIFCDGNFNDCNAPNSKKCCKSAETDKIECLFFIAHKNEISALLLTRSIFAAQLNARIENCTLLEKSFFSIPALGYFYKITIIFSQDCIPLNGISTTLKRILSIASGAKMQCSKSDVKYFVETAARLISLLKCLPEFSYSIFFLLPLQLNFKCIHSQHREELKSNGLNTESLRGKNSIKSHLKLNYPSNFILSNIANTDSSLNLYYSFEQVAFLRYFE